jgi:hypothetical protein
MAGRGDGGGSGRREDMNRSWYRGDREGSYYDRGGDRSYEDNMDDEVFERNSRAGGYRKEGRGNGMGEDRTGQDRSGQRQGVEIRRTDIGDGRNTPRNDRQGEDNRRNVREGVGEDRGGGEKRKIDERSPEQENVRTNRMRMDEFEIGAKFTEIADRVKKEVERIIEGMDLVENGNTEGMKKAVKEGLRIMTESLEGVMNGIGDAVATERKERERDSKSTEERLSKVETSAKETEIKIENVRKVRETERKRESKKELEDKLRQSNRQVKYLNINIGKETTNKKEIVDRVLEYMKDDAKLNDRRRLDFLLKRTRVIVLGKGTSKVVVRDGSIFSVPILLECRNEEDRIELEIILKGAGYFGSYHWPLEAMDFARGVREEVKKMGHNEERVH